MMQCPKRGFLLATFASMQACAAHGVLLRQLCADREPNPEADFHLARTEPQPLAPDCLQVELDVLAVLRPHVLSEPLTMEPLLIAPLA